MAFLLRGIRAGSSSRAGQNRAMAEYGSNGNRVPVSVIVPMKNEHKQIVGMLDAESDKVKAFGDEDKQFLERAAGLIAHCLT